jgi:hypothetical protein
MLRHQDRLRVPATALSAAMGWADWPARLQHLSPGPLIGSREVWLDGGHNPSAARQVASYVKRHFIDGKPLHLIFASLTRRTRRDARTVQGSRRASTPRQFPITAASFPKSWSKWLAAWDLPPTLMTTSSKRSPPFPMTPSADLRLALSCGRGSGRERPGAELGFRRRVHLRCSVRISPSSFGGDAHPLQDTNKIANAPAAAVQRNTVA